MNIEREIRLLTNELQEVNKKGFLLKAKIEYLRSLHEQENLNCEICEPHLKNPEYKPLEKENRIITL